MITSLLVLSRNRVSHLTLDMECDEMVPSNGCSPEPDTIARYQRRFALRLPRLSCARMLVCMW
jgi:hypothetical protein